MCFFAEGGKKRTHKIDIFKNLTYLSKKFLLIISESLICGLRKHQTELARLVYINPNKIVFSETRQDSEDRAGGREKNRNGKEKLRKQRQASPFCHQSAFSSPLLHMEMKASEPFVKPIDILFLCEAGCTGMPVQLWLPALHWSWLGFLSLLLLTSSSEVLEPRLFQPDSPHLRPLSVPSTAGLWQAGLLPVTSNSPNLPKGSWDTRTSLGISWLPVQIL